MAPSLTGRRRTVTQTSLLQAGVARSDITPPIGIGHAGWGAQTHQRAAGVDLPLWVTALAISDNDQTVVILDFDAMYLFEDEASAVRDAVMALTGLPASHIRLSYTHTHSGPISGKSWSSWMEEGPEMVTNYDDSLQHKAAGAAWAAMRAQVPVRIAAGRGTSCIGINRRFARPEDGKIVVGRNVDGPIDPEVQVIRIDTLAGQPLSTIVDYACHPITVGPDCDLITPDYPGFMKRVVEEATGSTCLFLQGAAGDIGPIRGVARNGLHEYRRLGAILGHEVSRIWWELELPARTERYSGTLESGAPLAIYEEEQRPDPERQLRVVHRSISLPTRPIGDADMLGSEKKEYIDKLNQLRRSGSEDDAVRDATMHAKRATMRAGLARQIEANPIREVEVQGISLGNDIVLLALAAEPFSEIGRAIKDASPFQYTLVSGYSNVGWAYLPTANAYSEGGYEVEVSPFSPDAEAQTVAECGALLQELAGAPGGGSDAA